MAAEADQGPDLYWQTHSTVSLAKLLAEASPLSPELEAMLIPPGSSHG